MFFYKFFRSRLFVLAAFVFLIFVGIALVRGLSRAHSIGVQIANLQKQAKELEGRNSELAGLSDKLKDPDFVEREARIRFGLQKPGESVVVVRVPSSSPEKNQTVLERLTNAHAWWLYFFDHESFKQL